MKEIRFMGKTVEELKNLSLKDFAQLIPSRQRRSVNRGFTDMQKKLLKRLDKVKKSKENKAIKTHCRDMVVIPEMLDQLFLVHNGNKFVPVKIIEEMLGHYLGEFAMTRTKVKHSTPGIGATRSSASLSVK